MTLVCFSWVANQRYFRELMDQELRTKLYSNRIEEKEQEITPFGFISDGNEDDSFIDSSGTRWETVSPY